MRRLATLLLLGQGLGQRTIETNRGATFTGSESQGDNGRYQWGLPHCFSRKEACSLSGTSCPPCLGHQDELLEALFWGPPSAHTFLAYVQTRTKHTSLKLFPLLKYNVHTIKPTLLKCTGQWLWYIHSVVQLLPLSNARTFSQP